MVDKMTIDNYLTKYNFKTDQAATVCIWLFYWKKPTQSNVEPINCFANQGCEVNSAATQSNQSFFCCVANKIIKQSLRVDVEFQTCVMETFTAKKRIISIQSKSQVDLTQFWLETICPSLPLKYFKSHKWYHAYIYLVQIESYLIAFV